MATPIKTSIDKGVEIRATVVFQRKDSKFIMHVKATFRYIR